MSPASVGRCRLTPVTFSPDSLQGGQLLGSLRRLKSPGRERNSAGSTTRRLVLIHLMMSVRWLATGLGLALACGCSREGSLQERSSNAQSSNAQGNRSPQTQQREAPSDDRSDCTSVDGEVVRMTTSDGVELEGDLYLTGIVDAPSAVLLHMIPPGNDRGNYTSVFINKLVAAGFNVLNMDRRGAGNSKGVAREAYTGPNGRLDAEAAVSFLQGSACAPDPARIAFIGASNGTTTALDYTVGTDQVDAARPKALVFLTGGTYTEAQNKINERRALLDSLPIQFVFSAAEARWSTAFRENAPAGWRFSEYDPGGHGTRMFEVVPSAMDDVVTFLTDEL